MNFFKSLKKTDYIIIILILLVIAVAVFVTVKKSHFSKLPVESEKKVYFQVFLRGVTLTDLQSPIENGDESFITIRNVPYTKLKVVNVIADSRKIAIAANTKEGIAIVDDPATPFVYDFLVTLEDTAKVTNDGYVVGGNKLKIGIPIVLEGFNYKLSGIIANIKTEDEIKANETK